MNALQKYLLGRGQNYAPLVLLSRERQDRNNITLKCLETQQECATFKAAAMCAAFCWAKRKRGWLWDCCEGL